MTPTAALQAALTDLTGPTFGPTDPGYDAAKRVYNAMIDKSPALIAQVAHRGRRGRRRQRRARPGSPARRARWRSQRWRSRDLRRRAGHRPRGTPLGRGGSRRRDRTGRWRLHLGPGGHGHRRLRARHPERHPLHHRCRRADPRWWTRSPDAGVRPGHRQPARGGGRAGRRQPGAGERDRGTGPVLGPPRRRRQLRRGHLVHLPAERRLPVRRRAHLLGRRPG